jgi:hypothetical protein
MTQIFETAIVMHGEIVGNGLGKEIRAILRLLKPIHVSLYPLEVSSVLISLPILYLI